MSITYREKDLLKAVQRLILREIQFLINKVFLKFAIFEMILLNLKKM